MKKQFTIQPKRRLKVSMPEKLEYSKYTKMRGKVKRKAGLSACLIDKLHLYNPPAVHSKRAKQPNTSKSSQLHLLGYHSQNCRNLHTHTHFLQYISSLKRNLQYLGQAVIFQTINILFQIPSCVLAVRQPEVERITPDWLIEIDIFRLP